MFFINLWLLLMILHVFHFFGGPPGWILIKMGQFWISGVALKRNARLILHFRSWRYSVEKFLSALVQAFEKFDAVACVGLKVVEI